MMERVPDPQAEMVQVKDILFNKEAALAWTKLMQQMSASGRDRSIGIGTSLEPPGLVVVTVDPLEDLPGFTGAFTPGYARHTADIFEMTREKFIENPYIQALFPGIIGALRSEADEAEKLSGVNTTRH